MNYSGLIIGIVAFVIIGVFHPIVIKGEYYFTDRIWPLFLVCGIIFCVISIFLEQDILSSEAGILGFT